MAARGDQLQRGSVIGGYRIDDLIGRGGMGLVYRATNVALHRIYALKVLAPGLAEDDQFRQRFQREMRIAASLHHPNIVGIHYAGDHDGLLFFVMDYVTGTDLREILLKDGAIEPHRAVDLLEQLASALDAAHGRGLVHRDVKPANILITVKDGEEHGYLTDFGLAKKFDTASGLTVKGSVVGTVDYMAPEQITGERTDARTDIYALGCVFYQMLSGNVPYERDNSVATLFAHVHDPPPPLEGDTAETYPTFSPVLEEAMAKDPSDRYLSAGDFARDAMAALRGMRNAAPPTIVATGEATPFPAAEAAAPEAAPLPRAASAPPAPAASAPPAPAASAPPGGSEFIPPAGVDPPPGGSEVIQPAGLDTPPQRADSPLDSPEPVPQAETAISQPPPVPSGVAVPAAAAHVPAEEFRAPSAAAGPPPAAAGGGRSGDARGSSGRRYLVPGLVGLALAAGVVVAVIALGSSNSSKPLVPVGKPYTAAPKPVPTNHVTASGAGTVRLNGNVATVTLDAQGLLNGSPHAMHIHAGGKGVCPPASAARLHNGHKSISTTDGIKYYGPPQVSLTSTGDTSTKSIIDFSRYPTVGTVRYTRAITIPRGVAAAIRAGNAAIILHGIDYNHNGIYDNVLDRSELKNSLPGEATAPAICGSLVASQTANASGHGGAAGRTYAFVLNRHVAPTPRSDLTLICHLLGLDAAALSDPRAGSATPA